MKSYLNIFQHSSVTIKKLRRTLWQIVYKIRPQLALKVSLRETDSKERDELKKFSLPSDFSHCGVTRLGNLSLNEAKTAFSSSDSSLKERCGFPNTYLR